MGRPTFPRSLLEFQSRFATEEACRAYLTASRWPEGFRCPRCGNDDAYELRGRPLLVCSACSRQTSVTAGTILHGSRQPLRTWFWAAYLVATQTPGVSATQLQRQLGLRRYETAWTMLQKLRRAMRRPDRERLRGEVEVDETFLGGTERGRRGGRARDGKKIMVVAAVEVRGKGSGRLRLAISSDSTGTSLSAFIRENVEPKTIVRASGLLPRVHRVFSNLKTWIAGTHHGIGRGHVRSYLDEFVFRFNQRGTPMAAFQSLPGLTAVHGPTTYKALYGRESTG